VIGNLSLLLGVVGGTVALGGKLIKILGYIGGTQMYIVVTGQKGIGKTCLIDTALKYTCGVTKVDVKPDADGDYIIDAALRNLTNMRFNFIDRRASAKRLIWWYNLVASQPPILYLMPRNTAIIKVMQILFHLFALSQRNLGFV
jgi:hypothetical protein